MLNRYSGREHHFPVPAPGNKNLAEPDVKEALKKILYLLL